MSIVPLLALHFGSAEPPTDTRLTFVNVGFPAIMAMWAEDGLIKVSQTCLLHVSLSKDLHTCLVAARADLF